MNEYARRDEWLGKVQGSDWQDARLMATADMRADGRDADGALVALTEMQAQGGRRLHAQQIALRAHQQLKNWGEVLKLVKTLEKREALHPAVAVRLRQVERKTCCVTGGTIQTLCWNSGSRCRRPSGNRLVLLTWPLNC